MAEIFSVVKVIDSKIGKDGHRQYKVKWADSWEPEENLSGCIELINEYWESLPQTKIENDVYNKSNNYTEARKKKKKKKKHQRKRKVAEVDDKIDAFEKENKKQKTDEKDTNTQYIEQNRSDRSHVSRLTSNVLNSSKRIDVDNIITSELLPPTIKEEPTSEKENEPEEEELFKRTAKLKASFVIRKFLEKEYGIASSDSNDSDTSDFCAENEVMSSAEEVSHDDDEGEESSDNADEINNSNENSTIQCDEIAEEMNGHVDEKSTFVSENTNMLRKTNKSSPATKLTDAAIDNNECPALGYFIGRFEGDKPDHRNMLSVNDIPETVISSMRKEVFHAFNNSRQTADQYALSEAVSKYCWLKINELFGAYQYTNPIYFQVQAKCLYRKLMNYIMLSAEADKLVKTQPIVVTTSSCMVNALHPSKQSVNTRKTVGTYMGAPITPSTDSHATIFQEVLPKSLPTNPKLPGSRGNESCIDLTNRTHLNRPSTSVTNNIKSTSPNTTTLNTLINTVFNTSKEPVNLPPMPISWNKDYQNLASNRNYFTSVVPLCAPTPVQKITRDMYPLIISLPGHILNSIVDEILALVSNTLNKHHIQQNQINYQLLLEMIVGRFVLLKLDSVYPQSKATDPSYFQIQVHCLYVNVLSKSRFLTVNSAPPVCPVNPVLQAKELIKSLYNVKGPITPNLIQLLQHLTSQATPIPMCNSYPTNAMAQALIASEFKTTQHIRPGTLGYSTQLHANGEFPHPLQHSQSRYPINLLQTSQSNSLVSQSKTNGSLPNFPVVNESYTSYPVTGHLQPHFAVPKSGVLVPNQPQTNYSINQSQEKYPIVSQSHISYPVASQSHISYPVVSQSRDNYSVASNLHVNYPVTDQSKEGGYPSIKNVRSLVAGVTEVNNIPTRHLHTQSPVTTTKCTLIATKPTKTRSRVMENDTHSVSSSTTTTQPKIVVKHSVVSTDIEPIVIDDDNEDISTIANAVPSSSLPSAPSQSPLHMSHSDNQARSSELSTFSTNIKIQMNNNALELVPGHGIPDMVTRYIQQNYETIMESIAGFEHLLGTELIVQRDGAIEIKLCNNSRSIKIRSKDIVRKRHEKRMKTTAMVVDLSDGDDGDDEEANVLPEISINSEEAINKSVFLFDIVPTSEISKTCTNNTISDLTEETPKTESTTFKNTIVVNDNVMHECNNNAAIIDEAILPDLNATSTICTTTTTVVTTTIDTMTSVVGITLSTVDTTSSTVTTSWSTLDTTMSMVDATLPTVDVTLPTINPTSTVDTSLPPVNTTTINPTSSTVNPILSAVNTSLPPVNTTLNFQYNIVNC